MDAKQARAAAALDQSVEDFGRRLCEDPDRLRAVLLDAMGSRARESRASIDVLVVAAEEGVPDALLRRRKGLASAGDGELTARLVARGFLESWAEFSVTTWRTAIGSVTSVPETVPAPLPESATAPTGSSPVLDDDLTAQQEAAAIRSRAPVHQAGRDARGAGRQKVPVPLQALLGVAAAALLLGLGYVLASVVQDEGSPPQAATARVEALPAPTVTDPERLGITPSGEEPSTGATTSADLDASASEPVAPTGPPVAMDFARQVDYVQNPDGSVQEVTLQPDGGGAFDAVEVTDVLEDHGVVRTEGTTIFYRPNHNGDFLDVLTFRLLDSATQQASSEAAFTISGVCNPAFTCYEGDSDRL